MELQITEILEIEIDFLGQLLIMVNGQEDAILADKIEFDHAKGTVTITV